MFKLRYYQQEAVNRVEKGLNGIFVLPTGSGKSLVISGIAQKFPKDNILILQPTREILQQNYKKLINCVEWPQEVGIYSASCGQKNIARITLATIGSIKSYEQFYHFKIMIIDECHLVNAIDGQYERLIRYNDPDILIGLTATPYRLHSSMFGYSWRFLHRTRPKVFKQISYIYQNKQAFDDNYLLKPTYHEYSYNTENLSMSGSDYDEESIFIHHCDISLHDQIIEIVKNTDKNHILVFVKSIREAKVLSEKLENAGIRSSEVSSKNTKKEREQIIKFFKNGYFKVVINVGILTTGFDFPELDCIIGARPTTSLGLYYQMLGRGVRINKGKDTWDYFDLCGNVKTFGRVENYVIEGKGSQTSLKNKNGYLIKPYEKQTEDRSGNWVLTFGKFKGTEIWKVNSNYLKYCLSNFNNFKYKTQFELELARRAEGHYKK